MASSLRSLKNIKDTKYVVALYYAYSGKLKSNKVVYNLRDAACQIQ